MYTRRYGCKAVHNESQHGRDAIARALQDRSYCQSGDYISDAKYPIAKRLVSVRTEILAIEIRDYVCIYIYIYIWIDSARYV